MLLRVFVACDVVKYLLNLANVFLHINCHMLLWTALIASRRILKFENVLLRHGDQFS